MSGPMELRDAPSPPPSTGRNVAATLRHMSAILEIPEVRRRVSHLSVEEYHRLEEFNENGKRTELIRGILIEKMSKSPLHFAVSKHIYDLLQRLVSGGWMVRQEGPLTLADSEPEPDVAVVRGEARDFIQQHPATAGLVVEVAVSSAVLDRENTSLYAEASVTEYWIVLAKERQVEVYREPLQGRYAQKRLYHAGETIDCAGVPGVSVRVSEIFP